MGESKTAIWKNIFFSQFILSKKHSAKLTITGVITAFLVVCNSVLEVRFFDTQFSLTIVASALAGIFLGSALGFSACFIADLIGFMISGGGLYMPWVALSTAFMAFLSGVIFNGINLKCRGALAIKIALICLSTFWFVP